MSQLCEDVAKTLKEMLDDLESKGPIKETLSSFIGICAGIPVNEEEMISDVSKGLKSYEKNMNDFCALGSVLKRPKRTHTYIAHLDDGQLKGFKLLPSQEMNESETKVGNAEDANTSGKVERKHKRKKSSKQPKIVLTFKKTDQNQWKPIEGPQKIVPIYTERISGKPSRRSF